MLLLSLRPGSVLILNNSFLSILKEYISFDTIYGYGVVSGCIYDVGTLWIPAVVGHPGTRQDEDKEKATGVYVLWHLLRVGRCHKRYIRAAQDATHVLDDDMERQ